MKNRFIILIVFIVLLGCELGFVYSQSEENKAVFHNKLSRIEELLSELQGDFTKRTNIADLMDLAEDENPIIRTNAVSALGTINPGHHESLKEVIIPFLSKKLSDEAQSVRRAAAKAIGSFGEYGLAAVPHLIKTSRSDYHTDAGWYSAEAIGNIGPEAKEGIPTLIWMLGVNRDSQQVSDMAREYALKALVKLGPHGEDALPSLLELLNIEEKPQTQALIIQAIYQLDRASPELEVSLRNLYKNHDVWFRYYAVKTIESFERNRMPNFATDILKQATYDQDEDIRSIAIRILKGMSQK